MIKIGDEFKHKFSYTQEEVDLFAKVSGDTNPLHIDEDYAKSSIFGKRIMHGYLGACVFTKIFGTLLHADGHIYMSQSFSFRAPMYAGEEYEAVVTVKQIFPEKNRILYLTEIYQGDTLCTTGEALLLNKKIYVWS